MGLEAYCLFNASPKHFFWISRWLMGQTKKIVKIASNESIIPQPLFGDVPIIFAQSNWGISCLPTTAKSSLATSSTISRATWLAWGISFSRSARVAPLVPSMRFVSSGFIFCSRRNVGVMKLWANTHWTV